MKVEGDILEELGRLPESLSDLYAVIYDQISRSGRASQRFAEKALQWLTVAKRPLSPRTLINVASRGVGMNQSNISPEDLLDMTANLLIVDESVNAVRFAHLSVWEYLVTRREFSEDEAHLQVALTCLEMYNDLASPLDQASIGSNRQAMSHSEEDSAYSSLYWPIHASNVEEPSRRMTLVAQLRLSLLASEMPESFRIWRQHVSYWSSKIAWYHWHEQLAEILVSHTPFLTICVFDFWEILESHTPGYVQICSRKCLESSTTKYQGLRGSEVALASGNLRTAQVLATKGVNIKEKTLRGESSLHLVVRYQQSHLIPFLVGHGVHPDEISSSEPEWTIKRQRPRSSLGFRSSTGQGVNSVIDPAEEPPLHLAALNGSRECVEELLAAGADIDRRDSLQATPLMKALEGTNYHVMDVLLRAGADVNAALLYHRNALHFAAAAGDVRAANMLLSHGANPWVQDYTGSTAIDLARRYNNDDLALNMEKAAPNLSHAQQEGTSTSGRVLGLNLDLSLEASGLSPIPDATISSRSVAAEWKRLTRQQRLTASKKITQKPAAVLFSQRAYDLRGNYLGLENIEAEFRPRAKFAQENEEPG